MVLFAVQNHKSQYIPIVLDLLDCHMPEFELIPPYGKEPNLLQSTWKSPLTAGAIIRSSLSNYQHKHHLEGCTVFLLSRPHVLSTSHVVRSIFHSSSTLAYSFTSFNHFYGLSFLQL